MMQRVMFGWRAADKWTADVHKHFRAEVALRGPFTACGARLIPGLASTLG